MYYSITSHTLTNIFGVLHTTHHKHSICNNTILQNMIYTVHLHKTNNVDDVVYEYNIVI